jgi:hypothetical protein
MMVVLSMRLLRRRGQFVLADRAVAVGVERAEQAIDLRGVGARAEALSNSDLLIEPSPSASNSPNRLWAREAIDWSGLHCCPCAEISDAMVSGLKLTQPELELVPVLDVVEAVAEPADELDG